MAETTTSLNIQVNSTNKTVIELSEEILKAAEILTLCIIIFGSIGNILTLVVIATTRPLRSVSNMFIANLSVADGLYCMIVLPFHYLRFMRRSDSNLDEFECSFLAALGHGLIGVGLITIGIIAFNRLHRISCLDSYQTIYTILNGTIIIIMCWLFPMFLSFLPIFDVWGSYTYNEILYTCIFSDEDDNGYRYTITAIGFIIPCLCIILCYTRIFYLVRKSRRQVATWTTTSNPQQQTRKETIKFTAMSLVIFLTFLICSMPYFVLNAFHTLFDDDALFFFSYLTGWLQTCVNPVIYVAMNKTFRQGYKKLFTCKQPSLKCSSINY